MYRGRRWERAWLRRLKSRQQGAKSAFADCKVSLVKVAGIRSAPDAESPLPCGAGEGPGAGAPAAARTLAVRTGARASDRDPKGGDPQQYRGAPFAQRQ
jgi:hypothetical protein